MTAPTQLQSYLCDQWQVGIGHAEELFNPSTEELIATTCTTGLDFESAFDHARTIGGPALRAMTFAERGALLTKMAAVLHEKREYLLEVSRDCNGATRGDSKFDVDGATGTLSTYGRYGSKMGDDKFQLDGTASKIAANARHMGQHFRLPREGVAFHINAFNFPAWGAFEKIACAFLAGMPVVTNKVAMYNRWLWPCLSIQKKAAICGRSIPPNPLFTPWKSTRVSRLITPTQRHSQLMAL